MRSLLFVLSFLSSIAFAASQKGPEFSCSTEFPTTSFYAVSNNNSATPQTILKMVNHHGGDYIPVHTGTILASDLVYIQEKAALLKKLGKGFAVTFDTKKCTVSGPELFACGSSEHTEINGIPVTSFAFTTRVIDTKVYEYTFKTHQVNFSFTYKGMSYDVPMTYSQAECNFSTP